MRQLGHRAVLGAIFFLAALSSLGAQAHAASATMFDEGRAQQAFTAIQERVGHALRVLTLTITPDELSVEIANPDKPGEAETWSVAHNGLIGALGVDVPVRQGSGRASLPGGGAIAESVIEIDAAGLAIVPKLAADALARARFRAPGRVAQMELLRLPKFVGPAARDPYWSVHVEAPEEEADISAKITGELTNADLRRTKRAENLDLLAGGPDFDEMVQNIRKQIKDDWIFHYIEIEKTDINFDVHLASVQAPRLTRFTATISDIKTDNLSMPHMAFPGEPGDDPFTLADVDLSLMTKLEATAKQQLGIADGVVQRVVVSKPHRERAGAVEWEVQVKSAKAPLFWTPNSPPVEEGSVTFDAKGAVLHAKYPPGRGPQTNLFDPAALQKAIDKIAERLGPHVQLIDLDVSDASIRITAQDPQNAKKFAVFTYRDGDVARAAEPFQTMANAGLAGPSWLWDIGLLPPSVVQSLAALEKQTLTKLGAGYGKIDAISFTKDKVFYPDNDRVLIEIRAAGDGDSSDNVIFDLAGGFAKLDGPSSGIRIGAGAQPSAQDEEGCTRSEDPEKVIPACTRLAEDAGDTPHNRAVAYYDRANAYKSQRDYDRALADYSAALALEPKCAHAYLNRSWVYAAKNDAVHSIADSSRAIELDPTNPLAYLNRGLAYRFLPNYAAAIADYNKAIRLGANSANAYQDRGRAYAGKGDLDKAAADYGEALKRDPRDPQTLIARADVYRAQGKLDLAIADDDAAIKLDPGLGQAYNDRGVAYRLKGEFDRAIADGDQAIRLYSKWAAPYYARGFAYFLAGSVPKALADLTQANTLAPNDAYIVLLLDIVGQRSKLPSRLGETSAKLDMSSWPAPVIRLYLSQLTAEATLAAAADPDPQTKRGRVCEANFYTGELALRSGRADDANRLLAQAARDCPPTFTERELAIAELKTIRDAPTQGKP
jgi:tetratricopeptide (TPR) repeat protein